MRRDARAISGHELSRTRWLASPLRSRAPGYLFHAPLHRAQESIVFHEVVANSHWLRPFVARGAASTRAPRGED